MTLNPSLQQAQTLLLKYQQIRHQSLLICEPLEKEDYVVQPISDVSPPKWHLGHVTWFFENFILVDQLEGYKLFDPRLNYIFNSYYESQGERILRSNRGNMSRPTLESVLDYRRYVDKNMEHLLEQYEDQPVPSKLIDLLIVGLQHEQQHQELLVTDIKYILGHNPLFPDYLKHPTSRTRPKHQPATFHTVPEGLYEIGHQGEGFCWDNELSVHKVFLQEFQIQDRLVTNGEYLDFINAGGYDQHEFWLSDGWDWVKQLEVKAPLYWYVKDGEWWHFTLGGLRKIDLDLPVTHVSYYEADAFARWKGCRLPTEFEWEVACRQFHPAAQPTDNFLESKRFHPNAKKETFQMLGDTWEWTASAYLPYPHYPRFKGALGEYNGKFMVDQMVLRGGSCATPASHIRITYRNFFQTDKRWQFTGVRLAK